MESRPSPSRGIVEILSESGDIMADFVEEHDEHVQEFQCGMEESDVLSANDTPSDGVQESEDPLRLGGSESLDCIDEETSLELVEAPPQEPDRGADLTTESGLLWVQETINELDKELLPNPTVEPQTASLCGCLNLNDVSTPETGEAGEPATVPQETADPIFLHSEETNDSPEAGERPRDPLDIVESPIVPFTVERELVAEPSGPEPACEKPQDATESTGGFEEPIAREEPVDPSGDDSGVRHSCDNTAEMPAAADESLRQPASSQTVEDDDDSKWAEERANQLEHQVDETLGAMAKMIEQDREQFKEVVKEIDIAHANVVQEMSAKAQFLKELLCTVREAAPATRNRLLGLLEHCFATGCWMERKAKPKRLVDMKESMKQYIQVKYGGIAVIERILADDPSPEAPNNEPRPSHAGQVNKTSCDQFLVNVTAVNNPGDFYVVRRCDTETRRQLFTALRDCADTLPTPQSITSGEMYAVLSSTDCWFRGVAGRHVGLRQVGDNPPEKLYEFFLLDQGNHEHIGASKVRELPADLSSRPALALSCTLSPYFRRTSWTPAATAFFKQMTGLGPMSMKVFSFEAGVLNVDLAQLPRFDEDANIVSVRDALMLAHRPQPVHPTEGPPVEVVKFKPYFCQAPPPKYFRVRVMIAVTPFNIYVHHVDEEREVAYRTMDADLNGEFANATRNSPSYISIPINGVGSAVLWNGQWRRALIEVERNRTKVNVFFVDVGQRHIWTPSVECHRLPKRFYELPARAVRLNLDNIQPSDMQSTSKLKYSERRHLFPRDIKRLMQPLVNRTGVAFVECWLASEVGRGENTVEMLAYATLYCDDERCSVNTRIGASRYARSTKKHDLPGHAIVRAEIMAAERSAVGPATSSVERLPPAVPVDAPSVSEHSEADAASATPFVTPKDVGGPESLYGLVNPPQVAVEACAHENHHPPEPIDTPPRVNATQLCADDLNITPLLGERPSSWVAADDCRATDSASSDHNSLAPHNPFRGISVRACFQQALDAMDSASPIVKVLACDSPNQVDVEAENDGAAPAPIMGQRGTQPLDDEVGMEFIFGWCYSPARIYGRTPEMRELFGPFTNSLQAYYNDKCKRAKLSKGGPVGIGAKRVVTFEGTWYRAEVCEECDAPYFTVILVDLGYERVVHESDIFCVAPEFEDVRRLCLCFSLHGVYPLHGDEWEGSDCELAAHFITKELGCAESVGLYSRTPPPTHRGTLSCMVNYVSDIPCGPLEMGGLMQLNLNEELVEKKLASSRPTRAAAKPAPTIKPWKPALLPTQDRFWAQVTWVDLNGHIYLHDIKAEDTLRHMAVFLANRYDKSTPSPRDLDCQIGDPCVARYQLDKSWCRGVVRGRHPTKDEVDIFFIDYGTLDCVPSADVRVGVELHHLPSQAMACALYDVRPLGDEVDDAWPISTLDYIHRQIVEREFLVTVKKAGNPTQVKLSDKDEKVFNNLLCETNLARYLNAKQARKMPGSKKPRRGVDKDAVTCSPGI